MRVETVGDLAMAYSPGVAQPCLAIAKNPDDVYRFTGNQPQRAGGDRVCEAAAERGCALISYGPTQYSPAAVLGRDYIIPKPLDGRLHSGVAGAVARAAIDSGEAIYPFFYPFLVDVPSPFSDHGQSS